MRRNLTIEDLAKLDDGRVGVAVNHALRQIAHDLKKRPGEQGTRRLTIAFDCKPIVGEDGLLDSAEIRPIIATKLPKTTGRVTTLAVDARGELVWNDASPDDPRQATLDEVDKD